MLWKSATFLFCTFTNLSIINLAYCRCRERSGSGSTSKYRLEVRSGSVSAIGIKPPIHSTNNLCPGQCYGFVGSVPTSFESPGSWSGSISQRHGSGSSSGSGSFYHQAIIVKKKLDSYCFVTSFWLFIFENDVDLPSKINKQKNFLINFVFFVGVLKVNDENSRIRIH